MMKTNFIKTGLCFLTIILGSVLTSCKPKISVSAVASDDVKISFSTGFSSDTAAALKAMTGASAETPLFSKDDVSLILSQIGAQNSIIQFPSPTEISTAGTIPAISSNPLGICKLIERTEKSLKITLGPEQFKAFYNLLNEEFKAYFDLMMIPALTDEKMSIKEYEELLASMYGPTFAKDVVNGTLEIFVSSPDGKKVKKESVSLGEILTLTESKSWLVNF